jgi:hypothetical protein
MALKPCRECSKEISDTASVCPQCGVHQPILQPPPPPKTPQDEVNERLGLAVIGAIAGAIAGLLGVTFLGVLGPIGGAIAGAILGYNKFFK